MSWFRRVEASAGKPAVFVVHVKAKPRSKRNAVVGLLPDLSALEVAVTAPPVDGEANEAIIEVLSRALGIRKSALSIARGGQSRLKQIIIEEVSEEQLRMLEHS